jgi:hypothetical protein
MTKATPEQIRVFRHRRLLVILGSIGILLGGFLLMIGLLSLDAVNKNGKVAIGVCFGTVLLIGLGMTIFKVTYFRCPVCGHSIPSVATRIGLMLGHRCNHCDIDFAAS